MVDFGRKLKELRKQKNLTQKELASLIGVKNSIISFYEVGERIPSPEILIKLASVLHVTSDYLLGIEKCDAVDVSGLDEEDKHLIRALVDNMRKKNVQKN